MKTERTERIADSGELQERPKKLFSHSGAAVDHDHDNNNSSQGMSTTEINVVSLAHWPTVGDLDLTYTLACAGRGGIHGFAGALGGSRAE